MKHLESLQERYAKAQEEFDGIYAQAEDSESDFTAEQKARMVELNTEMAGLEKEIDTAKAIEQRRAANLEAKQRSTADRRRYVKKDDEETRAAKQYSFMKAVRSQLPNSSVRLDGLEKEMHDEAVREARAANITDIAGVAMPSFFLQFGERSEEQKRNLVVGTDTAGGFTVDTELRGLIPFLRPRLTVEAMGATTFTGLSSNIDFPRNDAVTSATWEGETDANADSEPTFDRVQMRPHRLGANTPLSKQLIVQSSIDVEAFVRRQLERAIAEALDTAAISGDSSAIANQPDGILNIAGVNSVAIGTNGGALTWSHIVEMESAVATQNADFGRLGYITTPGVRGALKTTTKDAGSGQFIWSDGPAPAQQDQPRAGELNSYRAMVTTLMPDNLTKGTGTNLHSLIFGNFEELMIGQWGGLDLVVDPYSLKKEGQIELTANTWWDIALRHPESFSAIVDAVV